MVTRARVFACVVAALITAMYLATAILTLRNVDTYSAYDAAMFLVLFLIIVSTQFVKFPIELRSKFKFSPDFVAPVLAVLYLPLELAVFVTVLGLFCDFQMHRSPEFQLWEIAMNGAVFGFGVLFAAGLLQFVPGHDHPTAIAMLPIAFCAVVFYCVGQSLLFIGLLEVERRGAGWEGLKQYIPVAGFEIVITTIAVVMTMPFMGNAFLALTVLALFQLVLKAGSQLSTNESLQRHKNEYLRDVFGRYVPSHVADALAESGQEIRLGGEQREISVLFCDIRGFTAWSEGVEPETVLAELNVLLGGLSAAVMQYEGTLDKFTGDGLMAFWGAPLDQPDHADRACAAAIEMLQQLAACNEERVANGQPAFEIGVGVHSGLAVVGNVGHEDRLDYTAIGDTVNTSARLEAATKEVGTVVLLSQETHTRLQPGHAELCEWVGSVSVKGKKQPVEIYTVSNAELPEVVTAWTAATDAASGGGDGSTSLAA